MTKSKIFKTIHSKIQRNLLPTSDWPPTFWMVGVADLPRNEILRRQNLRSKLTDSRFMSLSDDSEEDSDDNERHNCGCLPRKHYSVKSDNLTNMVQQMYDDKSPKRQPLIDLDKPLLKCGPDGSLICTNDADMNMIIAGFIEFERSFKKGHLLPFANVLPESYRRHSLTQVPQSDASEDDNQPSISTIKDSCQTTASISHKSISRMVSVHL